MGFLDNLFSKTNEYITIQLAREIYLLLTPDGQIVLNEIAIRPKENLILTNIDSTLSFGNVDYPIYQVKFQNIVRENGLAIEDPLITNTFQNNLKKNQTYYLRTYSFLDLNRISIMNEFDEYKNQIFNQINSQSPLDFNIIDRIKYIALQRILAQSIFFDGKYHMSLNIKAIRINSDSSIDKTISINFNVNNYNNTIKTSLDDLLRRTSYNILNSPGTPKDLRFPIYRIKKVDY